MKTFWLNLTWSICWASANSLRSLDALDEYICNIFSAPCFTLVSMASCFSKATTLLLVLGWTMLLGAVEASGERASISAANGQKKSIKLSYAGYLHTHFLNFLNGFLVTITSHIFTDIFQRELCFYLETKFLWVICTKISQSWKKVVVVVVFFPFFWGGCFPPSFLCFYRAFKLQLIQVK